MKQVSCTVVILSAVLAVAMAGMKDFMESHAEISQKCLSEADFSEDEVAAAWSDAEVSHNGHCYMGCMFRELTMIEDGKFMPDKAKALAAIKFEGHDDKLDLAKTVIDECAEIVTSEEECETGHQLFHCIKMKKAEHGLEE